MQSGKKAILTLLSGLMLLSSVPMFSSEVPVDTFTPEQIKTIEKMIGNSKKGNKKNIVEQTIAFAKKIPGFAKNNPGSATVIGLILAGVYRFNMKSADDKPARYDMSKLNPKNLFTQPKTFFRHFWYLIDDGIIGRRYGKDEGYKYVAEKDRYESFSFGPQGFGGYLHVNAIISLTKTLGFAGMFAFLMQSLNSATADA